MSQLPALEERSPEAETCPHCGVSVPADSQHCGACGASTTGDPLIGRTIDERYEVVRGLGQGGMGAVYEVQHLRLKKRFAMKFIRRDLVEVPGFARRFEREALATSKQKHPNCVAVTDFGHSKGGELYLVMEFLEGRSLREFLGKPMAVARALSVVRQITLALQHAHRNGVVHRDIKADNVILLEGPDGEWLVKVLDFGLAVPAESDDPDQIAEREVVCGTPTYMAPEQFTRRQTDERSDLYAVGVILWYLLTGRPVFETAKPMDLLRRKAAQPAPSLDRVAPGVFSLGLQRLVEKALQRQPEQRFASAEALLAALADVQRSKGGGLATGARNPLLRGLRRGIDAWAAAWAEWRHEPADGERRLAARLRRLVGTRSGQIVLSGGLGALLLLVAGVLLALLAFRAPVETPRGSLGQSGSMLISSPAGEAPRPLVAQPRLDLERRFALVRLLISKGACREAALDMEALLRDHPNLALAHQLYGAAQICRGRTTEALAGYAQAIAIDRRYRADSRIIEDLSLLLASKEDRDRAIEFLAKRIGKPALEPLLNATTDPDRVLRAKAVVAVSELGGRERIDWVTVYHLDLQQLEGCRARARVIARLSEVTDRRALEVLRQARREKTRRRRRKHACVMRQLDRAIKKLRARLEG